MSAFFTSILPLVTAALVALAAPLPAQVDRPLPAPEVPILTIDSPSYTTCVGESAAGTVRCSGCVFPNFDGFIQMSSFNTGVVTVSPLNYGPILVTPFSSTFAMLGVAEGNTTIQAALFQQATLIGFVRATVTVLPAGTCPSGGCPTLQALAGQLDASALTDLLHRFRDQVMRLTPVRQRYVDLYYRHALEAAWQVAVNPDLRQQTLALLRRLAPVVQELVDRQESALSLADVQAIEHLMDEFEELGSTSLQSAVVHLREELRSGQLFDAFRLHLAEQR